MSIVVRLKIDQTYETTIEKLHVIFSNVLKDKFEVEHYDDGCLDFNFEFDGKERTLKINRHYDGSTHLYETYLRINYFDKADYILKKMLLEFNFNTITMIQFENEGYYP